MLALRSCAYSMYTCIYAIYAVANITIDPILVLRLRGVLEHPSTPPGYGATGQPVMTCSRPEQLHYYVQHVYTNYSHSLRQGLALQCL